jgi:hypothetical protein
VASRSCSRPPGGGFVLPAEHFAAQSQASYLVAARLNGDNRLDLAVTGLATDDVSILLGEAGGSFADGGTIDAGPSPFDIAAADLNRDGDRDLVVGSYAEDGTVSIHKGRGDGTFGPAKSFPAGSSPNGVAVGRLNADRKPDIAVADYDNQYTILLAKKGGKFSSRTKPLDESPAQVDIFDYNGDRRADLAIADGGRPTFHVLRGKGRRGRFRPALNFTTAHGQQYGIATGRFNDDKLDDVAVTSYFSGVTVRLSR